MNLPIRCILNVNDRRIQSESVFFIGLFCVVIRGGILEVIERILRFTVKNDAIVDVDARRIACSSHLSDGVAFPDFLPFLDLYSVQMTVNRFVPIPVLDLNTSPERPLPFCAHYDTVGGCIDVLSPVAGDIDSGVIVPFLGDGMSSPPEVGCKSERMSREDRRCIVIDVLILLDRP